MPFVARYHALKDFPVKMNFFETDVIKKEVAFDFTPPDDIVLEDSGVNMPYLSYRADPENDVKDLKLKVEIHTVEVSSLTLNGGISRTINELIPGSLIRKGETNKIIFKVEDGGGTVEVSDVIFWFIRSG